MCTMYCTWWKYLQLCSAGCSDAPGASASVFLPRQCAKRIFRTVDPQTLRSRQRPAKDPPTATRQEPMQSLQARLICDPGPTHPFEPHQQTTFHQPSKASISSRKTVTLNQPCSHPSLADWLAPVESRDAKLRLLSHQPSGTPTDSTGQELVDLRQERLLKIARKATITTRFGPTPATSAPGQRYHRSTIGAHCSRRTPYMCPK